MPWLEMKWTRGYASAAAGQLIRVFGGGSAAMLKLRDDL